MSVKFHKSDNAYRVMKGSKTLKSYGIGMYGKYAKSLADHANETGEFLHNYFEINEDCDYIKMIVYSKKYGYKIICFDKEDFERVKQFRWGIRKDNNTFYVRSKIKNEKGKWLHFTLHRFILKYKGDEVIDHLNRNGLDNRKNNLRIVSHSINMRNRVNKGKNTVFQNVTYKEYRGRKYYCVFWTDKNKKSHTKTFSIKKYGKKKAYIMAVKESIKQRKKNGYIVNEILIVVKRIK